MSKEAKCSRCRHHGRLVPQRGHRKLCAFSECKCWKCDLVTQRSRVTARQRTINRTQEKKQQPEEHCRHQEEDQTWNGSAIKINPEPAADTDGVPLDLRIRAADRGMPESGLARRKEPPGSRYRESWACSLPYVAAPPLIGRFSINSCSRVHCKMQWLQLPPVPYQHAQQRAAHRYYLPTEPGPVLEGETVYISLQPTLVPVISRAPQPRHSRTNPESP